MARADGLKAGFRTRFSQANQPVNRGRKPSKLKKWVKENGVTKSDYVAIFNNIIAAHTIEELQKMIEGENKNKLPVIVALCISAFIHDMKTGTLTAANSVLDRIMGKPTQHDVVEISAIPAETLEMISDMFSGEADANAAAEEEPQ